MVGHHYHWIGPLPINQVLRPVSWRPLETKLHLRERHTLLPDPMHLIDHHHSQYVKIGGRLRELCKVRKTISIMVINIRVSPTLRVFLQVNKRFKCIMGIFNVLEELLTLINETFKIPIYDWYVV